jgi:hypothetical protein
MKNFITWVDNNPTDWRSKIINQSFPVVVCVTLFALFIWGSLFFIHDLINPFSAEKILIEFHLKDFLVGFFLYFVTAVDYALIIGRMQVVNKGLQARFTMNVFTCVGCFVGVSLVLFLWGFAKEVNWLIIPLLIFAGCVMVKLGYEGLEYFEDAKSIFKPIRVITTRTVTFLHTVTQGLTFWIPELGSPAVQKMSLGKLAMWSFLLPFIIGLDDFVGYMGAMTIYNVFSLLVGIYLADIVIDILIFISPSFTKKMVESAVLSLLATYAFMYLMYKSFWEAWLVIEESLHHTNQALLLSGVIVVLVSSLSLFRAKKRVIIQA